MKRRRREQHFRMNSPKVREERLTEIIQEVHNFPMTRTREELMDLLGVNESQIVQEKLAQGRFQPKYLSSDIIKIREDIRKKLIDDGFSGMYCSRPYGNKAHGIAVKINYPK